MISSDRQVVPHKLRPDAELLHVDLRHAPEAGPELYWQAPPSYLGDRVSGHIGPSEWCPCPGRRPGIAPAQAAMPRTPAGTPGLQTGSGQGSVPRPVSRCHPTVGPSTTSCTRRPSGETCLSPQRAGRTWCCR